MRLRMLPFLLAVAVLFTAATASEAHQLHGYPHNGQRQIVVLHQVKRRSHHWANERSAALCVVFPDTSGPGVMLDSEPTRSCAAVAHSVAMWLCRGRAPPAAGDIHTRRVVP